MDSATVWNPGIQLVPLVNANSTLVMESFLATPGQTLFNLSNFAYVQNVGSLLIYVQGVLQRYGVDYAETSTTSFTLTEAPMTGDLVTAMGFVGMTGVVATYVLPAATTLTLGGVKVDGTTIVINSGVISATTSGNAGTVTHTGALTADALLIGNGTADITALVSLGTAGQVLISNGAGNPPSFQNYTFTYTINNTPVGYQALNALTSGTGNTAVGSKALLLLTSGNQNTAVGDQSLAAVTTASTSTAIGALSLKSLTTGASNNAHGKSVLQLLTTGQRNNGMGTAVLASCITGSDNTAIGDNALALATGSLNTAIGSNALTTLTSGVNNTAIGYFACGSNGTANDCVGVGYEALLLATAAQNTAVGSLANSGANAYVNTSCFGYNSAVTGSNQVQLGNASTTTYAYGAVQNRSDSRDKADIRDTVLGLDFINSLRPVDFKWDMREDYTLTRIVLDEEGIPHTERIQLPIDGSKKRSRYHHGFIAQDFADKSDFGGYQDHSIKGGADVKSLGYEEFIAPLVKSVQELSAKVKLLEARN